RLHTLRQVFRARFPDARCALTPDGKKVWVSCRGKKDVRLWEIATGEPGPELPLDAECVAMALSPDGALLFIGNGTRSQLWDTTPNRPRDAPLQHQTNVRCAAFSPDGQVLATGHEAGVVQLWDVGTGRLRADMRGHEFEVLAVAFTPDGKKLATGGVDLDNALRLGTQLPGSRSASQCPTAVKCIA